MSTNIKPKLTTAFKKPTRESSRIQALSEFQLKSQITSVPPAMDTNNVLTSPAVQSQDPLVLHTHPDIPVWLKDIYSQLNSHTAQLNEMQTLLEENRALKESLDKANLRIKELETSLLATTSVPVTNVSKFAPTPPIVVPTPDVPTYAHIAKAKPTHRVKSKKFSLAVPESRQAAARAFAPISDSQGFQSLYFPNRGRREPISIMRNRIQALGLQNSRVLDIHYPARHVVAFLVHNDYTPTVLNKFADMNINPVTFNPTDSANLHDPKFASCSPEDLKLEATRIFQDRLQFIIQRVHDSKRQVAIARDFCFRQKLLSETQYVALLKIIKPVKSNSDTQDQDDVMTDVAAQFHFAQASQTDSPSNHGNNPADGSSAPTS